MHMFLFKGAYYFTKEMDLVKVKDKEEMHVQLWSIVLSQDREDASFLKFDRCFASKIRILLCTKNPKIPKALLEFLRLEELAEGIKIVHNWGDMYLYLVSTIFQSVWFQRYSLFTALSGPIEDRNWRSIETNWRSTRGDANQQG